MRCRWTCSQCVFFPLWTEHTSLSLPKWITISTSNWRLWFCLMSIWKPNSSVNIWTNKLPPIGQSSRDSRASFSFFNWLINTSLDSIQWHCANKQTEKMWIYKLCVYAKLHRISEENILCSMPPNSDSSFQIQSVGSQKIQINFQQLSFGMLFFLSFFLANLSHFMKLKAAKRKK